MRPRRYSSVQLFALVSTLLASVMSSSPAAAQAWTPLAGTGTFSLSYDYYDGGDHLFPDESLDGTTSRGYTAEGNHFFIGDTFSHGLLLGGDYGITDRLAVSGGIGWMRAAYFGRAPVNLAIDDGEYRSYLTNVQVSARYMAVRAPLVVTPFLIATIPTQDYPNYGHSSPGGGLAYLGGGVALGRPLIMFERYGYAAASGAYTLGEEYEGRNLYQWNLRGELAIYPVSRLGVGGLLTYMDTGGGLPWISENGSEDAHQQGGNNLSLLPLSNSQATRVGGWLNYQVKGSLSLGAQYMTTIDGENLEDANILTMALGYGFDFSPRLMGDASD